MAWTATLRGVRLHGSGRGWEVWAKDGRRRASGALYRFCGHRHRTQLEAENCAAELFPEVIVVAPRIEPPLKPVVTRINVEVH